MSSGIKVFAPASVANVAVGFDILGFALEKPGDEIIIKEGKTPGLKITSIKGAQGKLPTDLYKNTAGYAALKLLEYLGEEKRPLEMEIIKKMPFGSGLGSSAASAVAGAFGVSTFLRTGLTKRELLRFAVEGERVADGAFHADNVAPALLGGMILIRNNETLDHIKLYIPKGLMAVVIYPEVEVLTKDSRNVLSKNVPFSKFVTQTGNLGGFIASMFRSDFDLMKRSLQDVIVEPQRAALVPFFYDMKALATEAGALGFSISGAGPSMFALCNSSIVAEDIAEKAKALYSDKKINHSIYISNINHEGAVVC